MSRFPNGTFVLKSTNSMESGCSLTVLGFEAGIGLYPMGLPSGTTGSVGKVTRAVGKCGLWMDSSRRLSV